MIVARKDPLLIRVDYCKTSPASAMSSLLQYLPLSLAVREAMRMRALAEFGALETPVLDIGCGDGLFWEVVTRHYIDDKAYRLDGLLGVDINTAELDLASVRLADTGVELKAIDISSNVQIHTLRELHGRFRTVIANCSLEHVPSLDQSLANIRKLLKDRNSVFYLFVPAPDWTECFRVKQFVRRFSPRLAGVYGALFDGFFQHHHLYPPYVWKHLLEGNGFSDVEIVGLGSKASNRLFERWLLPAFASFAVKSVVNHYPSLFQGIKAKYVLREARFLQEMHDGTLIHTDLHAADIVEYFIRCQMGPATSNGSAAG